MRMRKFVAAAFVAALAVVAVTATSASGGKAADTLTVWLQVDAQSGWPDVVAAANAPLPVALATSTIPLLPAVAASATMSGTGVFELDSKSVLSPVSFGIAQLTCATIGLDSDG